MANSNGRRDWSMTRTVPAAVGQMVRWCLPEIFTDSNYTRDPQVEPESLLHSSRDLSFGPANGSFIAPIESPLLDAFGGYQTRLHQDFHVLTRGGLADRQLPCDQQTADAVPDQIAI